MSRIASDIFISQSVAILVDGNNLERSIHDRCGDDGAMLNFDTLIPRLIGNRALNRLVYFREGNRISTKLAERLHDRYHGSVVPCHKSADIPLSIKAMQLAAKVDTIIIMSGDSDYIELVRHLKSEGVRVEIAAVRESTSGLLKEEADYYHPITEEDWFILHNKNNNNYRRNNHNHRHASKRRSDHRNESRFDSQPNPEQLPEVFPDDQLSDDDLAY